MATKRKTPDGFLFKYTDRQDAVCATKDCKKVHKHVNAYYMFKYGDKELCPSCAKKKRII